MRGVCERMTNEGSGKASEVFQLWLSDSGVRGRRGEGQWLRRQRRLHTREAAILVKRKLAPQPFFSVSQIYIGAI